MQDHLEEEEFGHFEKDDLHFVLSHIERNQQYLMEEIQKLSHGGDSSDSGGGIGNAVVLNRFDALDEKIKTLTHHINSLTEVLNQVVERVNGGGSGSGSGGKDNSALLDKLHDLNSDTNRRIASLEDSHARTAKKAGDIHDKIQSLTSDPVKTGVSHHYSFSTVLWWILGLLVLEIVVYGVYRYIQVSRSNENSKKFI